MKSTISHGKTFYYGGGGGFSVLYDRLGGLDGLQVIHIVYEILGREL